MLRQLESRQAALSSQEAELKAREAALANSANTRLAAASGGELLPPGAKPGQCFTRVWLPPQYKTVTNRKLVSEAGERIEVIPAKYGNVQKRVLVQEASTKLVTVPATYRTVTEKVLVRPARTVTETVAPVYETVTERIVDRAAHTTWKKGTGPIQRINESTGEIMCLIEVPATYKTITKQVLKTPASTRNREIPAEYRTVTKRVVATEATTRTVQIPAKYSNVSVTEEVRPSQERRIAIPEKYTTVTSRELVTDGKMDWREIMCETNTTPGRIMEIQRALQNAGYNPGPIDGGMGPSTIKAVNAFQRSKGLPVDRCFNELIRFLRTLLLLIGSIKIPGWETGRGFFYPRCESSVEPLHPLTMPCFTEDRTLYGTKG